MIATKEHERKHEIRAAFNRIDFDQGATEAREFMVERMWALEKEVAWRKKALDEVTVIRCRGCSRIAAGWVYNPCPKYHGVVERHDVSDYRALYG